jgi:predicted HD superfamily hydrolase involved in NAD metabolism
MEFDEISENLKKVLSEKRYLHSFGVEEVACDLALLHGFDMEKAKIAGILHDCAKYLTNQQLLKECQKYDLVVTDIEVKCPFLLHAKVGAIYARIKYGIQDEQIISAITYHTTGRPAMSLLEKIIFTADYIEPYRKPLPRIEEIRKMAYTDIDIAVAMVAENVLDYLRESNQDIDTLTIDTYHYYRDKISIR